MTTQRATIAVVAVCVVAGITAGAVGLMSSGTLDSGAAASNGSGATTTTSAAPADGSTATDSSATRTASNNSPAATDARAASGSGGEQGSDCDLVDVDGNDNMVSVNITSNATTDDGVAIRFRCEANNATPINHDLIDVTGNNNTVTVVLRVEDGTIVVGGERAANSSGHVTLQCEDGTDADCDAVDIDGHNNSVTLIVQRDTGRTVHEFGSNSSAGQRTR